MLYQYPSTSHLPWSENITREDKVLASTDHFEGQNVVVTIKMDGEVWNMYSDSCHPRSLDGQHHPSPKVRNSRDWVKRKWASIKHDIPTGWRICGENLFAKHSIFYTQLESYFLAFSIWNKDNICLGWDETVEWLELLTFKPVPVIYRGAYDEKRIRALWNMDSMRGEEGYVVRIDKPFHYQEFGNNMAKFVRKDHIQTDQHWIWGTLIPNQLANPLNAQI
jgi:uncharacterized protein YbdZ (MbtH family)